MLERIATLIAMTMLAASCSNSDDSNGGSPDGGSSDTFSCETAKSKCPSDGPIDVPECKTALGHPACGQTFLAFMMCIGDHQICNDAGETDIPAWMIHCADEQANVKQCFDRLDGGP